MYVVCKVFSTEGSLKDGTIELWESRPIEIKFNEMEVRMEEESRRTTFPYLFVPLNLSEEITRQYAIRVLYKFTNWVVVVLTKTRAYRIFLNGDIDIIWEYKNFQANPGVDIQLRKLHKNLGEGTQMFIAGSEDFVM